MVSHQTSLRRTTVPLRCEVLEAREMPASMSIGGEVLTQTKANYLAIIKYLTVAPADQTGPVFNGTDMAAIKKLEQPLRRQIFNAMDKNPTQTFNFLDLQSAEQNIEMRIDIIEFMNAVGHQDNPAANQLGLKFSYFDASHPPTANPAYWSPLPSDSSLPSREFAYRGSDAYSAVMSITQAPYVGECLGTAEIAILYAAADVLGQQAFNQMFPTGVIFGPQQTQESPSVLQLLPHTLYSNSQKGLSAGGMVPGDFAYMHNRDDYFTQTGGTGYWNGENAIYMGRYDQILNGVPVFKAGQTQRFSGLGLYDQSASDLREALWSGYCTDVLHHEEPLPANSGIRWTMDDGPGTSMF